jgi:hypothetical protein
MSILTGTGPFAPPEAAALYGEVSARVSHHSVHFEFCYHFSSWYQDEFLRLHSWIGR